MNTDRIQVTFGPILSVWQQQMKKYKIVSHAIGCYVCREVFCTEKRTSWTKIFPPPDRTSRISVLEFFFFISEWRLLQNDYSELFCVKTTIIETTGGVSRTARADGRTWRGKRKTRCRAGLSVKSSRRIRLLRIKNQSGRTYRCSSGDFPFRLAAPGSLRHRPWIRVSAPRSHPPWAYYQHYPTRAWKN